MKIIAISGHARSGKDTVAGFLKERLCEEDSGANVLITRYADLLKYVCKNFFNWNGEKDEAGRTLLQHIGTDVVRAQDPDFWVDFTIKMLRFFDEQWDFVIIPDVRFPNELTKLVEQGWDVTSLRVVRSDHTSHHISHNTSSLTEKQRAHSSETSMDNVPLDFCIENDGSLSELKEKINNWIVEVLYAQ